MHVNIQLQIVNKFLSEKFLKKKRVLPRKLWDTNQFHVVVFHHKERDDYKPEHEIGERHSSCINLLFPPKNTKTSVIWCLLESVLSISILKVKGGLMILPGRVFGRRKPRNAESVENHWYAGPELSMSWNLRNSPRAWKLQKFLPLDQSLRCGCFCFQPHCGVWNIHESRAKDQAIQWEIHRSNNMSMMRTIIIKIEEQLLRKDLQ